MESGQRGRGGGKKGQKWVDVLCTPVNLQISWPSQNVWAANVHRQMCSQQMSNWHMSGHPFLTGFFLSKRNQKNKQFFYKKHRFDRFFYDEEFPLKWVSEHAQFCKKRTNPTFRLCWLCRMPPCISLFSHHEGVFEEFFFCWKKVLGIECFFPLQQHF